MERNVLTSMNWQHSALALGTCKSQLQPYRLPSQQRQTAAGKIALFDPPGSTRQSMIFSLAIRDLPDRLRVPYTHNFAGPTANILLRCFTLTL